MNHIMADCMGGGIPVVLALAHHWAQICSADGGFKVLWSSAGT
jgi:hypothetical protein